MATEGWKVALIKCKDCGTEMYAFLEPKSQGGGGGQSIDEYSGKAVCTNIACWRAFEVTLTDGDGLEVQVTDLGTFVPKKTYEIFTT